MALGASRQPVAQIQAKMNKILINELTPQELCELIEQAVRKELSPVMKQHAEERLYNVESARRLWEPAVSRQTIYNWMAEGKLPFHKIGGRIVFKYSELMDAVKTIKRYGGTHG